MIKKIFILLILMTSLFFNLLPILVNAQTDNLVDPDLLFNNDIIESDTVVSESTKTDIKTTPLEADPGALPPQDLSNQGKNNLPATPPAPQGILVLPDPLNLNADIAKAPGQLVTRITNIFLGLIGIGALIVIIYGGALYLFSMGDPKKADKGRKVLGYAIIGLAIILGAYIIINTALSVLTQVTK